VRFTKRDFWFSIITGLETGIIGWTIADFLGLPEPFGHSWAWLVVAVFPPLFGWR